MSTDEPKQAAAPAAPSHRTPEAEALRPGSPAAGLRPAQQAASPSVGALAGAAKRAQSASPDAQQPPSGPSPSVGAFAGAARRAGGGASLPGAAGAPPIDPGAGAQTAAAAAAKRGRKRFFFFGKRKSRPAAAASDVSGSAASANAPHATSPALRLKEPIPSVRPADAPPDPWTAFATAPERGPGRIRRGARAVARGLIHEYALVTYAALLIAVGMTWPALRYPLHTLPQDLGDPARQAWQIAWSGHILLTDPVKLWQSNAFYPEPNSFAYGDSLLGYAPAGLIGEGPLAATLRYNILFVLAHALLLIGAYALVRQLGAGRTGSAVAAAAFAYAPWRLAQEGHLDVVSAGAIPLALAMLARGHGWSMRHGFRPDRRNTGWAAFGWVVAAWQISLGFSLGLPFLGALGLILLVLLIRVPIRWLRRPAERPVLGWRLLITDTLGPLIVAGVAALIALPYFKTGNTGTATAEIKFFSPPVRSLLIGPAESRIWGSPHSVPRSSLAWPAEMSLLPGFVLYALALAGLAFSIWTLWQRLFLLAGLAATIILGLGTTFLDGRWTYLPIFGHLPASLGVRIPGRLMVWTTLLLAVLAAGAVAEFVRRAEHLAEQRIPPWPGPWLRLATLLPLALVLLEGWAATAHPVVPAQPTAMRTVTGGPMLVLPTAELTDQMVMLWSTSRFQPIANGSGGFASARQAEMRRNVANFPDQPSVDYLRSQGVKQVLLLRAYAPGTSWDRAGDVPVDALGISREDLDDAVLFRLDAAPGSQPTDPSQPGTNPQPTVPSQPGLQPTFPTLPGTQPTFPTQPGAQPVLVAQGRP